MRSSINIMLGFLLGIIILLLWVNIFGQISDGASKELKNLQSCNEGFLGTLGGGEGKCYATPTCELPSSAGFSWQYAGTGKGCEAPNEYCCIQVRESFGFEEISRANCDALGSGTIALLRDMTSYDACITRKESTLALVEAAEPLTIRYYLADADKKTCAGTMKLTYGKTTTDVGTFSCTTTERTYDYDSKSLFEILVSKKIDKAVLNNGAELTITINAASSHEASFTVVAREKVCSEQSAAQCKGKNIGVVPDGLCESTDGITCTYHKGLACELVTNNGVKVDICEGKTITNNPCWTEGGTPWGWSSNYWSCTLVSSEGHCKANFLGEEKNNIPSGMNKCS